ncbi:MAG: alpha-amylase family protein [Planctomycetota bacterium]
MSHRLRYRQVHLDFHTSPDIPDIGEAFDAEHWQRTLRDARVDSITCFATCHHGHAYYDTRVGQRHPHLRFDLLRRQFDASKAIGVNVPIYLTAGINDWAAAQHPEWREIDHTGKHTGWAASRLDPGYKKMCFNTPYLDLLCEQIEEVTTLFPDHDGIFLDIIMQGPCCCDACLRGMHETSLDPADEADRHRYALRVLDTYFERTTAAVRAHRPDAPVFHNSSHVTPGQRGILKHFSHLELESLPTGGWGYDHFPFSARYATNLPHDVLGMTGKFHNTWGEFGGFKHPNALRYECAAMLAHGTKCSVGDQLHPNGKLDGSTYQLLGRAYAEVEAKEPYCDDARNMADIGLLSAAAFEEMLFGHGQGHPADTGASRLMLEAHFLFDVLDAEMDFSNYRLLILPDTIPVDDALFAKLAAYLDRGGRLLLTGVSSLNETATASRFDLGAALHGFSEFEPDYAVFRDGLRPDFTDSPHVMYRRSVRLEPTAGESLGDVYDPYFNRTYRHYSSHQHTPPRPEPSGFATGVRHGPITYLAHPLFTLYAAYGSVAYKQILTRSIRLALGAPPTLETDLPSNARVTLTHQPDRRRFVLHLLYANQLRRGDDVPHPGSSNRPTYPLEVVEDLTPLHDVRVTLRGLEGTGWTLDAPFADAAPALTAQDDTLRIRVPRFAGHELLTLTPNA